jgi:phenylacetate-CoA ligase
MAATCGLAGYIGKPELSSRSSWRRPPSQAWRLPSVTKAIGGLARPVRPRCATGWPTAASAAYQRYATADVGLIAYETAAREGLVLDEGVILELVRPGTDDPVPVGEVGEVVITSAEPGLPLGPLWHRRPLCGASRDVQQAAPTPVYAVGCVGRPQTTKIRGMFVHAKQVNDIAKRFPEVLRARLVVEGEMASDVMTLKAEVHDTEAAQALKPRIAQGRARCDQAAGAISKLCASWQPA